MSEKKLCCVIAENPLLILFLGACTAMGATTTLLGAVTTGGPEFEFHFNDNGGDVGFKFAGQQIFDTASGWNEPLTGFLVGGLSAILVAGLAMAVVYFILGSVVRLGYNRFNLELVDRRRYGLEERKGMRPWAWQ